MEHPDIIRVGWIEGNKLHNFLVLLYHLARIPLPLCAVLVTGLALPAVLVSASRAGTGLVLGAAILSDLALLAWLPHRGISFGWIQPPWLLFSTGRSLLALGIGLLPLGPSSQVPFLAVLQVLLSGLALYASLIEPFWIESTRLTVPLPGLGGTLRVLLLTDLHIERLTRRELRVLEAVRRDRPDLILIGGDLLNLSYVGDPRAMQEARTFVSGLSAPAGVFFVRGTMDVDPPTVVRPILQGLKVKVLEESPVKVRHNSASLTLVGVPAVGTPQEREGALRRLVSGAARPLLCLHHTPDLIRTAASLSVDLYLAGHTHGGQICLPLLGPLATASKFGRSYVRGLHVLGTTQAYISRGVGLEGLGAPRMRFMSRPELVWLSLVPRENVEEASRKTPASRPEVE